MARTRKIVLIAAAAGLLTGGLAATAGPATAAPADFPTSIQVFSDDTNLDEYYGNDVLTRHPAHNLQVWRLNKVGTTPTGSGIYTIRGSYYGKCLTAKGLSQRIVQQPCNSQSLSQRWILDTALDQTTVASQKYPDEVIQAHGQDRPVTLENKGRNRAAQEWTLYTK
ncbi:RICIN domain-containing protein [Streptomyces sp. NPDC026206]|uniref:RICIN domain-containing protein n=1 Tax=Streptomyces sp. NPDC026206 TaxID=3157089 RepID=UPI0033F7A377